jgi:hypothetical protein
MHCGTGGTPAVGARGRLLADWSPPIPAPFHGALAGSTSLYAALITAFGTSGTQAAGTDGSPWVAISARVRPLPLQRTAGSRFSLWRPTPLFSERALADSGVVGETSEATGPQIHRPYRNATGQWMCSSAILGTVSGIRLCHRPERDSLRKADSLAPEGILPLKVGLTS